MNGAVGWAGLPVVLCLVLIVFSGCAAGPTHDRPLRAEAFDGGQVQYDGMYYDFRAANGIQHIKMWVPPTDGPVRGVLFHGNPGGYGDTRNKARDPRLQQFAMRQGFGIIGVTSFPGRRVYTELAEVAIRAMDDWAALGVHPEIANLPMIARGSSNAGVTAYSMACFVPERMIAFTPNVGPSYNPFPPPDEALIVPALMHIGPQDPFFRRGMERTRELFAEARPRGARWAWTAEKGKGHEIRHINDINMKYYEQIIGMRLPAGADASAGPVQLTTIPLEQGWLADPQSWDKGLTYIAPYAEYDRDRQAACWLPTADIAFLYRAMATHDNPLELSVEGLPHHENPHESGVLLQTMASPIVEPGSELTLVCDARAFPEWERIEFYHGAALMGQVEAGQDPRLTFTLEPQHATYAISALGYASDGTIRAATPVHFVVSDPAVSAALSKQRAAYEVLPDVGPRPPYGSRAADDTFQPAGKTDVEDAVLLAYGLSPAQEQTFAADGTPSAFWHEFTEAHDVAVLNVADHLAPRDEGKRLTIGDPRVEVRAARSRAGLYLLFVVEDEVRAPASGLDDSVDFHIARRSSAQIWADDPADIFVKPESWALVLSGAQYQINLGTRPERGSVIARNYPDPWDMLRKDDHYHEAAARYGILVDNIEWEGRPALEVFIPWYYVGKPGPMDEPMTGLRLALTLGYKDIDPGNTPAQVDVRWPSGVDPWWRAGRDGPNPSPWGDLEMGPPLGG